MIELTKDEVTALLLDQEFYSYYEISDTKIKSKYLAVTRKVLKREELKITVYYEQRKPTWFTKLLSFSAWDVVAVDMPTLDIKVDIHVDINPDHLKSSPSFRGFRLKSLQDILEMTT